MDCDATVNSYTIDDVISIDKTLKRLAYDTSYLDTTSYYEYKEVHFAIQFGFHVNKSIETSNNCSNSNVNHEIDISFNFVPVPVALCGHSQLIYIELKRFIG